MLSLFCTGLIIGCADSSPTAICQPECRSGYTCVGGECVTACNPECATSETCVAGACVESSTVIRYDYSDANGPDPFVASGEIWDHTNLSYFIENFTPDMEQGAAISALQSAFDQWHGACAALSFTRVFDAADADIVIQWGSGEHGDGYPFDDGGGMNGNTLAHAYSPNTGIGGDAHFDEFETWSVGALPGTINLSAVALHEFGHSLGLNHSPDESSIMYEFFQSDVTQLGADDVAGITTLYDCNAVVPGVCGDGNVTSGEECDDSNLNGATCSNLGLGQGTLACNNDSCTFDKSGCEADADVCGDGVVSGTEQCEADNLAGKSCTSLGYQGGTLACLNGTCMFDTTGCKSGPDCGDGLITGAEQCENGNLDGATCISLGYQTGMLTCSAACLFDVSGCEDGPMCGDGQVEGAEQCDQGNLDGSSCSNFGYSGGTLDCDNASCTLDTSECCDDQCSLGETRCLDANTQQSCGSFDQNSCVEWGDETDCTCMNGACCEDYFEVTDYTCGDYSSANGGGPGGGEIFEVCGDVDSDTGYVTVKAKKFDGTSFGDRPYQVRVSGVGDDCGPDTNFFTVVDTDPVGIGTATLTFSFQANFQMGQSSKHYCVTASTKAGDPGYDGGNAQQKSWWWSEKTVVEKSCQ